MVVGRRHAHDRRGDRSSALAALAAAGEQARPLVLARSRTLPVAPALSGLLPDGALRRGSSVLVEAAEGAGGATALALALVAEASAAGSWVGAVGAPSLGLAAVAEAGVALERLVVVDPPAAEVATVVAALVDAVDVVCVPVSRLPRPADVRRIAARAREQGAVVVWLPPTVRTGRAASPPADVRFTVTASAWEGPAGAGAGRLTARRVEVVAGGRGAAARPRRAALWLPGPDGRVAEAAPEAAGDGRAGGRGAGAPPPSVTRLAAG